MKLKTFYETLRDRIFAVRIFKPLLKIPGMKKLLEYETVSYLFFGFCTFIVSTLSYWGVNTLASLFITAPETYDTWVLFSAGKLLCGRKFASLFPRKGPVISSCRST